MTLQGDYRANKLVQTIKEQKLLSEIIVLKIIYPFMFLLMIAQLPVIYITKVYLKNTNFGNYFYWLSVNLGVCLIFLVYNKAYIDVHGYNW